MELRTHAREGNSRANCNILYEYSYEVTNYAEGCKESSRYHEHFSRRAKATGVDKSSAEADRGEA